MSLPRVRSVSRYMIQIIRFMGLTTFRTVEPDEIAKAGESWAAYRGPDRRRGSGKSSSFMLTYVKKNWFRFHGRLAIPSASVHPFDKEIRDFTEFLRSTHGLSLVTVQGYSSRAKYFLTWLAERGGSLSRVSLNDVDEFFAAKRTQGWRLSTLANHGQALRAFFSNAAARGLRISADTDGRPQERRSRTPADDRQHRPRHRSQAKRSGSAGCDVGHGPEAGQADPQQAVGGGQFQAFCRRSPKHSDLVAQSQVNRPDPRSAGAILSKTH
jgi:hypothetical protein